MTVVQPFINRLDKIKDNLDRVANRVIIDHAEIIISLLKDNQLSHGLDSSGAIVGKYTYWTDIRAKAERQASGGRSPRQDKQYGQAYNFDWTGSLFETLTIKGNTSKNEFTIFSTIGKIKLLEKEFNTKLSDLTEENNDSINNEILVPKLQEYILNEMTKGLI